MRHTSSKFPGSVTQVASRAHSTFASLDPSLTTAHYPSYRALNYQDQPPSLSTQYPVSYSTCIAHSYPSPFLLPVNLKSCRPFSPRLVTQCSIPCFVHSNPSSVVPSIIPFVPSLLLRCNDSRAINIVLAQNQQWKKLPALL